MVLFLDFRRKPLLLLFFDPTALGGYISEDEEKAEAEAEAEEDIEIDYSRLSFQGCEEEKSWRRRQQRKMQQRMSTSQLQQ